MNKETLFIKRLVGGLIVLILFMVLFIVAPMHWRPLRTYQEKEANRNPDVMLSIRYQNSMIDEYSLDIDKETETFVYRNSQLNHKFIPYLFMASYLFLMSSGGYVIICWN